MWICFCLGLTMVMLVSNPDPSLKMKGGSGEYSTSSHHGLAVAMDFTKSYAFEVTCWVSIVGCAK